MVSVAVAAVVAVVAVVVVDGIVVVVEVEALSWQRKGNQLRVM